MGGLPDPDFETTERLLAMSKAEVGAHSASILSAIVCFLIGSVGRETTSDILREWADEVDKAEPRPAPGKPS
jgi:hypothetical protein